MGRDSRSGRRRRKANGRSARPAGRRAGATRAGARRDSGARRIEMIGAMDAATIAALELEVRHLARSYDAEIEDFRVEARPGSG